MQAHHRLRSDTLLHVIPGSATPGASFDAYQLAPFHIELFAAVKNPLVKAAPAQRLPVRLLFALAFAELVEVGGLAHVDGFYPTRAAWV